uniref:Uncharacterized protein n=1 Tax=Anguilla anguilla TaxID=7936 RepID=A0A0E9UMP2_ANGAN
MKGKQNGC